MAATFDPTLPTARDRIRLLIGDHTFGGDPTAALRQDETIDSALLLTGDYRLATAELADGLAAEYGQEPDSFTATGDMAISWRDRVKAWENLSARMRRAVDAETSIRDGFRAVTPRRDFVPDAEYQRAERWNDGYE